jgi:predicted ester cyclase
MTGDELRALYSRWLLEIWGAGRYELYPELFADDFSDHNSSPGQPPGWAGDEWFARMVRDGFPDLHFELDVSWAEAETGLVGGRWTMTGTNTGPIPPFGLPPTGRAVTMTGQETFRARNERFVEVWHQEDIPTMLDHLGLTPPIAVMRFAARMSGLRNRRPRRGGEAPVVTMTPGRGRPA